MFASKISDVGRNSATMCKNLPNVAKFWTAIPSANLSTNQLSFGTFLVSTKSFILIFNCSQLNENCQFVHAKRESSFIFMTRVSDTPTNLQNVCGKPAARLYHRPSSSAPLWSGCAFRASPSLEWPLRFPPLWRNSSPSSFEKRTTACWYRTPKAQQSVTFLRYPSVSYSVANFAPSCSSSSLPGVLARYQRCHLPVEKVKLNLISSQSIPPRTVGWDRGNELQCVPVKHGTSRRKWFSRSIVKRLLCTWVIHWTILCNS